MGIFLICSLLYLAPFVVLRGLLPYLKRHEMESFAKVSTVVMFIPGVNDVVMIVAVVIAIWFNYNDMLDRIG